MMGPLSGSAPGYGYLTAGERMAARRLIQAILDRSYAVQIFDGEEFVLPEPSRNKKFIVSYLGSTDEDYLYVKNPDDDTTSGWFHLVYGNALDGSEVVADWSANTLCDEIYDAAFPDDNGGNEDHLGYGLEPPETPDCQPSNPDECPACRGGRCRGEPS